jgi:UDPglucose 6-dehydrogenase
MNVTVVGTGYVGLVTGACLAEAGHNVTCVDNNEQKVAEMKQGISPIHEDGLTDVMRRGIDEGRLSFTTDLAEGVSKAAAIFLALPTPPQNDGSADLSAVLAVASQLGPILPPSYCVVIDKSTVPVGTAERVRDAIAPKAQTEFDVVSNPEFLREGHAVADFMEPERVVVGTTSKKAEQLMHELYASFVDEERPLIITDTVTAELSKYAANTFLFTKISFMNEIAQLSEKTGADVDMVRQVIGSDSRIGHKFLYPGIGAGGSCFPKDVRALKYMSEHHDYDFKLLTAAIAVNEQQQHVLTEKIKDHFDGDISGKTFALWGLAFKPNTDDIREAPALVLIKDLIEAGAKVIAYDPSAANNVRALYKDLDGLTVAHSMQETLEGEDALLIATEWDEFKNADLNNVQSKVIFDGRNIYQPHEMQAQGITYYSIGRRPVVQ